MRGNVGVTGNTVVLVVVVLLVLVVGTVFGTAVVLTGIDVVVLVVGVVVVVLATVVVVVLVVVVGGTTSIVCARSVRSSWLATSDLPTNTCPTTTSCDDLAATEAGTSITTSTVASVPTAVSVVVPERPVVRDGSPVVTSSPRMT